MDLSQLADPSEGEKMLGSFSWKKVEAPHIGASQLVSMLPSDKPEYSLLGLTTARVNFIGGLTFDDVKTHFEGQASGQSFTTTAGGTGTVKLGEGGAGGEKSALKATSDRLMMQQMRMSLEGMVAQAGASEDGFPLLLGDLWNQEEGHQSVNTA